MKILTEVMRIVSKEGILHFTRFAIVECKYFNIYLHRIYQADKDLHLHDHPWDYTSIILRGLMCEKSEHESKVIFPLQIIRNHAERFHKILHLYGGVVTSLFITGPRRRDWGYNVDGKWIQHEEYRRLKKENKLG